MGAALLSGCMTTPPPAASIGTTYECDRGTRLQVSYLREGALVRVNSARDPVPRNAEQCGKRL